MTTLSEALLEIESINTKDGLIDLLERIEVISKNTDDGAKTGMGQGVRQGVKSHFDSYALQEERR